MGEISVCAILRGYGHKVRPMLYKSSFDILVNDLMKIEVKSARAQTKKNGSIVWVFNIHRHGVLNENTCDYYILRIEDVPHCKKKAVHLLVPSPINKKTFRTSFRSLISDHSKYVQLFDITLGKKSNSIAGETRSDSPTNCRPNIVAQ